MTEKPKKQGGQTRKTLIIEDLVILVVICLLAGFAFASSALLPISVTIVNCGAKNELEESCLSDSRCCILLDEKRRRQKQKRENRPVRLIWIYRLKASPQNFNTSNMA